MGIEVIGTGGEEGSAVGGLVGADDKRGEFGDGFGREKDWSAAEAEQGEGEKKWVDASHYCKFLSLT